MATNHSSISFSKLHNEIRHHQEIGEYLVISLNKLERKLRGFCNENGPIPSGVKESLCRDLQHDSCVAGYLFESIESIAASLCREHPAEDVTGTDIAQQHIENGEGRQS